MKKTIIIAASAALLACTACNQEQAVPEISQAQDQAVLSVNIEGSFIHTKATGVQSNSTTSESKVSNFQVLVFNADGKINAYGKSEVENVLSTDVVCTPGTCEVYVVVNSSEDLKSITTKTDLLKKKSSLSDNALDKFVMIGSKSGVTIPATGSVSVNVDRIAARIVVKAIKNGFESQAFKVEAVYVTNVAGDALFSLAKQPDYTVSAWYGKEGIYTPSSPNNFTSPKTMVCDEPSATVAAGATYNTAHYFYVYPNNYPIANGGTWSPRATKIVVKLTINGSTYYYPINLEDASGNQIIIENNKSYEIELLTIGHNGNSPSDPDPEDKPVETSKGGFSIVVEPWTTVLIGSGSITI